MVFALVVAQEIVFSRLLCERCAVFAIVDSTRLTKLFFSLHSDVGAFALVRLVQALHVTAERYGCFF